MEIHFPPKVPQWQKDFVLQLAAANEKLKGKGVWTVKHVDDLPDAALLRFMMNTGIGPVPYCPITFVALDRTSKHFNTYEQALAGYEMGLTPHRIYTITCSADGRESQDKRLRHLMLEAVGLSTASPSN